MADSASRLSTEESSEAGAPSPAAGGLGGSGGHGGGGGGAAALAAAGGAAAHAADSRRRNCAKRVAKELHDIRAAQALPAGDAAALPAFIVSVGPADEGGAGDPLVWGVRMRGPAGSPYEGGVFGISIAIPQDYPFSAPRARFTTRVRRRVRACERASA